MAEELHKLRTMHEEDQDQIESLEEHTDILANRIKECEGEVRRLKRKCNELLKSVNVSLEDIKSETTPTALATESYYRYTHVTTTIKHKFPKASPAIYSIRQRYKLSKK